MKNIGLYLIFFSFGIYTLSLFNMKKLFSNNFIPILGKWYFVLGFLLLGCVIFMLENQKSSSLEKTTKPLDIDNVYLERFTKDEIDRINNYGSKVLVKYQDYWLKGSIGSIKKGTDFTNNQEIVTITINNHKKDEIDSLVANVYPQLSGDSFREKQKVYHYSKDDVKEAVITKKKNTDSKTCIITYTTKKKETVKIEDLYLISEPPEEKDASKKIKILKVVIYLLLSVIVLLVLYGFSTFFFKK